MATPKNYYWHGMQPYAYEWRGAPVPAAYKSRSSHSLSGDGSSVVIGLGGVLAVVLLLVWLGAKK